MARKYELRKRAESQDETRERIVEAAVELHTRLGPARTSISAIAEHAGVQRHTVYRHFPDERRLAMACSGLHYERHPLPDPEALLAIDAPEERLRRAVRELYRYYAANEQLLANVARDAAVHPLTREIVRLRVEPTLERFRELATPRRGARVGAAVALALDFRTWQMLVRERGLAERDAVETAVRAVFAQTA